MLLLLEFLSELDDLLTQLSRMPLATRHNMSYHVMICIRDDVMS